MATVIYTTPTINDTQGFFEYFSYINSVAGGIFLPVMLLVVWIVVFIASKGFSTSRAWTFASFMTMILSMILAVMDLVSPRYMYLALFMVGAGAVWLKLEATST